VDSHDKDRELVGKLATKPSELFCSVANPQSFKDMIAKCWAHMHRAEKLIYIYYLTAAVGLIAIVAPFRWPRIASPMAAFTLTLSIGLLCIGGYIAYAGGKIRHREFRNESPPKDE
jgi:hypothetical protein